MDKLNVVSVECDLRESERIERGEREIVESSLKRSETVFLQENNVEFLIIKSGT